MVEVEEQKEQTHELLLFDSLTLTPYSCALTLQPDLVKLLCKYLSQGHMRIEE
jgi:uncharacterized membrane protein YqjE